MGDKSVMFTIEAHYEDAENVEKQDSSGRSVNMENMILSRAARNLPPEDELHDPRHVARRVLRLSRSDTQRLCPTIYSESKLRNISRVFMKVLTCETGRHEHSCKTAKSADKRRTGNMPVLGTYIFMCLVAADVDSNAKDDKDDHGGYFERREPVFWRMQLRSASRPDIFRMGWTDRARRRREHV